MNEAAFETFAGKLHQRQSRTFFFLVGMFQREEKRGEEPGVSLRLDSAWSLRLLMLSRLRSSEMILTGRQTPAQSHAAAEMEPAFIIWQP